MRVAGYSSIHKCFSGFSVGADCKGYTLNKTGSFLQVVYSFVWIIRYVTPRNTINRYL